MLTRINSYTLNSKVNDYQEGLLIEFGEDSYRDQAELGGVKRIFDNEKFYWAIDNVFFGNFVLESLRVRGKSARGS